MILSKRSHLIHLKLDVFRDILPMVEQICEELSPINWKNYFFPSFHFLAILDSFTALYYTEYCKFIIQSNSKLLTKRLFLFNFKQDHFFNYLSIIFRYYSCYTEPNEMTPEKSHGKCFQTNFWKVPNFGDFSILDQKC